MPSLRYRQHWLTGRGACLRVADFVPDTPPLRHWAETFPWAALIAAVDRSCAQRFPTPTAQGRPPVSTRVVLALEVLQHELACADAPLCRRLRTDLAVMDAWGLTQVQVDGAQAHVVRPEMRTHFRSRLDAPRLEELLAIQAASALAAGPVRPAHVVGEPLPSAPGSPRVHDAAPLETAPTQASSSARPSPPRAPSRAPRCRPKCRPSGRPARRGARQGRGRGQVCVTRVRQPGTPWLALGPPVLARPADQPGRLDTRLTAALAAQQRSAHPARRRPQGKAVSHGTLVTADDPTMAPIGPGQRRGPAPFGRTPGRLAAPAAGVILAWPWPGGPPRDPRYVAPLVDHVAQAIARVRTRPPLAIHARAGDLALHDASWREAWPERGLLPVGRPKPGAPWPLSPAPEDVPRRLSGAGVQALRPPTQVALAYACGASRPAVDRLRASLRGRGAGRLTDKGHRRRHRAHGDGGHGAQRGTRGPPPRVSSRDAGTPVPPTAALEVP